MNKRSPERTPETTSPSCPIARDRAMATREICERSGAGTGTSRRKRARSREHGSTRNRVAKLLVGDDDVLLLREAERLSDVEFCTKWYLSQRASRRLREATLSACAAMATMQARGELMLSDAPPEDDEQYMHRLFCGDPEGGVGPKPPSKENNYTRDYCADFVNVDVLPLRRPRDDRLGTLVRYGRSACAFRQTCARSAHRSRATTRGRGEVTRCLATVLVYSRLTCTCQRNLGLGSTRTHEQRISGACPTG